ncbi:MAG: hypothetical protein KME15_08270 [Drouetiella hepatica Uher 2000/2452]|jgi:hypothetical protein|uniref:Uncharacterized protein n=1 Tax=Drouetiella hepatica Uher 2000/2452 TaxID=904376 RepID=A0A951UMF9_9CYAN|nr:hypothetical protein [Drouetiella hepatica Uher 2000/2452]
MSSFFSDCLKILRETFKKPFDTTLLVRSNSSNKINVYVAKKVGKQNSQDSQNPEEELLPPQNEIVKVRNSVSIGPIFKLAFLSALALTIVSLLIVTAIAIFSSNRELSEYQKQLFETCSTTWKMGFGAILGLIGGKAT